MPILIIATLDSPHIPRDEVTAGAAEALIALGWTPPADQTIPLPLELKDAA